MAAEKLPITKNPLKTKADFQAAVNQLVLPLKNFYSEGCALLQIGDTASGCDERVSRMEAFVRPLWGLIPLMAGGGNSELLDTYLRGIRNGTDPGHPEYWGELQDCDQRMVEMAALGLALAMIPEKVWLPLNEKEKGNFAEFLYKINNRIVVDTNWLFFRVLVNVGLKKAGAEYCSEMLEKDLNRLDEFYLGEGWYQDGANDQQDYYIAFAFHFYSLIYAQIMKEEDAARSQKYKERAAVFAKDFIYWFSSEGPSIPFGRSLIYRFAQAAFWSALVFADVEVYSWGVVKGLISRHLRWWFAQPVFNADGLLTLGYAYPNLNMAEGYNAPGSPYWALKTFLLLAVEDSHPFWSAEEEALPRLKGISLQKHPHMFICRQEEGKHVFAITSGQHAGFEPVHCAPKYGKFAYSTLFGFSVPRGEYGLQQLAADSMLALSEGDNLYRVRRKAAEYSVEDSYIYSRWLPWQDVEVRTWLVPVDSWHVRIHRISSGRRLDLSEGGFAIAREKDLIVPPAEKVEQSPHGIVLKYPWGTSGIMDVLGNRNAGIIRTEPNTNLLYSRTLLPALTGKMEAGEKLLICAVLGETAEGGSWGNPPEVEYQNGVVYIGKDLKISI